MANGAVIHQRSSQVQLPIGTARPVSTIVHGWHQKGFCCQNPPAEVDDGGVTQGLASAAGRLALVG